MLGMALPKSFHWFSVWVFWKRGWIHMRTHVPSNQMPPSQPWTCPAWRVQHVLRRGPSVRVGSQDYSQLKIICLKELVTSAYALIAHTREYVFTAEIYFRKGMWSKISKGNRSSGPETTRCELPEYSLVESHRMWFPLAKCYNNCIRFFLLLIT
jgi:hypothetical protein